MSDEEFLKRWSRRKQEAKAPDKAPDKSPDTAPEQASSPVEPAATAALNTPEPEVDLSKLPTIDSITAATDVTAFLRKNIPAELSRAALRRAWSADPAIRDFVGLAENAWDFTDPNAIPGFGALQGAPEQIGAMVERVIGGARDAAEKLGSELPGKGQMQEKSGQLSQVPANAGSPADAVVATRSPEAGMEPDIGSQLEACSEEHDEATIRRRIHGSALPDA